MDRHIDECKVIVEKPSLSQIFGIFECDIVCPNGTIDQLSFGYEIA